MNEVIGHMTRKDFDERLWQENQKGYNAGVIVRNTQINKAVAEERERIKKSFLKLLTVDSETQDARRKEFNQAIFMPDDGAFHAGCQVFSGTDLGMVMEKFDKAIKGEDK